MILETIDLVSDPLLRPRRVCAVISKGQYRLMVDELELDLEHVHTIAIASPAMSRAMDTMGKLVELIHTLTSNENESNPHRRMVNDLTKATVVELLYSQPMREMFDDLKQFTQHVLAEQAEPQKETSNGTFDPDSTTEV